MSQVIIHCQPILLDDVLTNQLNCEWSYTKGMKELDVQVDNIEGLNDEELCAEYGLNPQQVNSIEFI